jgi:hypothetical protein
MGASPEIADPGAVPHERPTGVALDVAGVRLDVETDYAPFAEYLAAQFRTSLATGHRPADVAVRVRWTEGPRPVLRPDAVFPGWRVETRIDRHVYLGDGCILCLRADDAPQIAIASEPHGATRRFEVRFHFTLGADGWRETLRRALRWRRVSTIRHNRLSTLTYYSVYYPAWWHLEARGAAHPLHAAGVAVRGRGLLLAGLPGCGKSTLATSFFGVPDAELLADNVVLHDESQIYGCFEPLLLDADTRAWLQTVTPLDALGRTHQYGRDAFHAPHRIGGVPLGAAVILARGRRTRLARLGATECARMLLAINEAAKEIRRYHILASQLGLLERDALAYFPQRVAHLEQLCARVPCYWLEVREGAPAEGVAALKDVLA